MAKKKRELGNARFSEIIKEVCDERNLRYDQVKPIVMDIFKKMALHLISGKSISIIGFGSIVTSLKVINRKSWSMPCHKDGKTYEVPCVPKLNFKLSLDKKIDPTKNYQ